jgi:acetyl-CoA C-acetyltransferase
MLIESPLYISYYAPRGAAYGHQQLNDAIIKDGLWDAYNNIHMVSFIPGLCNYVC